MRLNFSGQKTSQNLDACSAISNIEKMGLKDRSIKKKTAIRFEIVWLKKHFNIRAFFNKEISVWPP